VLARPVNPARDDIGHHRRASAAAAGCARHTITHSTAAFPRLLPQSAFLENLALPHSAHERSALRLLLLDALTASPQLSVIVWLSPQTDAC
jgi:hypothetical protein